MGNRAVNDFGACFGFHAPPDLGDEGFGPRLDQHFNSFGHKYVLAIYRLFCVKLEQVLKDSFPVNRQGLTKPYHDRPIER